MHLSILLSDLVWQRNPIQEVPCLIDLDMHQGETLIHAAGSTQYCKKKTQSNCTNRPIYCLIIDLDVVPDVRRQVQEKIPSIIALWLSQNYT